MKIVAKLLSMAIVLSMCFTLVSCTLNPISKWIRFNTKFRVSIEGSNSFSGLHFEIGEENYMYVKLFNTDVDDDTYKDVEISYNSENLVCEFAYDVRSSLVFKLYCYEITEGDTLSITYNGKTIKTTYTVSDYDMEAHGYAAPSSIADLNKYPEFKDMLLSLKYYEYTDPYVGLWDRELDGAPKDEEDYNKKVTYSKSGYKYYNCSTGKRTDSKYIGTEYTAYLKDSMYYPEKFDTVSANPVSNIDVYLRFFEETDLSEGSGRGEMHSFSISYSVIDPGCTNPKYPLHYMRFTATNKKDSGWRTVEYGDSTYPSWPELMLERHPEMFLKYQLGDTTIYILYHTTNGARAFFEDDTYFYTMYASYDND